MKTKQTTGRAGHASKRGRTAAVPVQPTAAPAGAELVDMAGAIALLKTTRPTFYRWLRSGKLKGMKVGRQWRFYRSDVERFLQGEGPRIELPVDLAPLLTELRQRLAAIGGDDEVPATEPKDAQAVALMIAIGAHMRASDLHLEPLTKPGAPGNVAWVRCRVDGVLHTVAELDLRLLRPLIQRWKILANADLHENRRPQDGRIMQTVAGRRLDLRVCFVPACLGEALTARFLDTSALCLDLDRIDYAPADKERITQFLDSTWGLLVVTGPTGSGKTTGLYACLNRCTRPEVKVMSVEDPVEYLLPGVTQIPVNMATGTTFAAAMRAVLRCDPDIIMVGEVRDRESLQVVMQSVLTGHLVMTTLHTDEAASALTRMVDIGADPFLVADAAKLVVAQRLVRKLCARCSRPGQPDEAMLQRAAQVAGVGGLDWAALPKTFREPVGCAECRQTGYRGRAVIAEALAVTPDIGAAVRRGAGTEELRAIAVREGMTTLAAHGLRRAATGQTTLEEVLHVAAVG